MFIIEGISQISSGIIINLIILISIIVLVSLHVLNNLNIIVLAIIKDPTCPGYRSFSTQ